VKDPKPRPSSAQVEQILAKEPNNVPALMVSALLARAQGRQADEAKKTCQKVLTIYPRFAPAMKQLAILYSRSQNASDLNQAYELGSKGQGLHAR
jgi:tetratricopeptide (TPR) repeat protein